MSWLNTKGSPSACGRIKYKTKEATEHAIYVMAHKEPPIGPLFPEFCQVCNAWHTIREKLENKNASQRVASEGDESHDDQDQKSRSSGPDH